MSCKIGNTYVGLTNDPEQRKLGHSSPVDWRVVMLFTSEREARDWERMEIAKPGQCGGPGGNGWRFGYKYSVTRGTRE